MAGLPTQCRQNNIPIAGTIKKESKVVCNQLIGTTNFHASKGWLGKFKNVMFRVF